jgi:rhodanese-related sulfurtransferase
MSGFLAMKAAGEAKADGQLSPVESKAAMDAGKVLVIDVRDTRDEWVEGSISASLGTLAFKADASLADFKDAAIADYPKSDPGKCTFRPPTSAVFGRNLSPLNGWLWRA